MSILSIFANVQWLFIAVFVFLLSGCDVFDTLFDSKKDQIPLPGKRIPILSLSQEEKSIAKVNRTPWPKPSNPGPWLQAARFATHHAGLVPLGSCLKTVWQCNPGSQGIVLSPPLLTEKVLYVFNADGYVYALSRMGETLWRTQVAKEECLGGGLCADTTGHLYVTTGSRSLSCLDQQTGRCLWKAPLGAPSHSPPVVSQHYVASLNMMNQLEVFDTRTGKVLWDHTGLSTETHMLGGSTPAICGNCIVVAYSSGEVIALSLDSGDVLWQQSGAPVNSIEAAYHLSHIRAHPIIYDNKVYTFSYNDQLSCFDLTTGHIVWKKPIGGVHTPVIVANTLYCLSKNNCLIAMDAGTGATAWSKELPLHTERGSSWAGPVAGGRFLYVTGVNKCLLALDPMKKGSIAYTYPLDRETELPPIIACGAMAVMTHYGRLIFFVGQ